MSVLVIAEPGCTHEGDKATLLKLLETAHQCGANVWKPQWTSDPVQMCERRHIGPDHPKRAYYERAYGWLAWPVDWHQEFRVRCHALGMEYACTVFLPEDVAIVGAFADRFKVSSFESSDPPMRTAILEFIRGIPEYRQPQILVSFGCGAESRMWQWPRARTSLLHCVSAYPAPLAEMNLRAITSGRTGLSDHSRHLLTGAVAVGAGAQIIETHYRLDTCHPSNPDYAVAFTPAEFTEYVKNIRTAEAMMGDGIKKRQPCEEWALPYRVVS